MVIVWGCPDMVMGEKTMLQRSILGHNIVITLLSTRGVQLGDPLGSLLFQWHKLTLLITSHRLALNLATFKEYAGRTPAPPKLFGNL